MMRVLSYKSQVVLGQVFSLLSTLLILIILQTQGQRRLGLSWPHLSSS